MNINPQLFTVLNKAFYFTFITYCYAKIKIRNICSFTVATKFKGQSQLLPG